VRAPEDVKLDAEKMAAARGLKLNAFIVELIREEAERAGPPDSQEADVRFGTYVPLDVRTLSQFEDLVVELEDLLAAPPEEDGMFPEDYGLSVLRRRRLSEIEGRTYVKVISELINNAHYSRFRNRGLAERDGLPK
jgi:hypothetical protein